MIISGNYQKRIYEAVAAVCPVKEVVIGVFGNSSTVSFFPAPGATAQQMVSAQSAINAFDWSDAAEIQWQRNRTKAMFDDLGFSGKLSRAIVLVLIDEINIIRGLLVPAQPARTQAQARNAILNKIDSGLVD